ncbi:hypothetical protein F4810DRAFT_37718 [Camillea tinctor]|nr:hypothetical protein F4810DRAFT_37718 [Camillea tinctor]
MFFYFLFSSAIGWPTQLRTALPRNSRTKMHEEESLWNGGPEGRNSYPTLGHEDTIDRQNRSLSRLYRDVFIVMKLSQFTV